jgi:hypothetical protein
MANVQAISSGISIIEDLTGHLEVDGPSTDSLVAGLATKVLSSFTGEEHRSRRGIALAKATYDGLRKLHPREYYT